MIDQIISRLFDNGPPPPHELVRRTAATLAALPMVAQALVDKAGHKVKIVSTRNIGACTDGKTLYIGGVPVPRDANDTERFVRLAAAKWGLLHHELAHVNATDFEVPRHRNDPLLGSLIASLEDIRIEAAHMRRFPVARKYLECLTILAVDTGMHPVPTEDKPDLDLVSFTLLYAGRLEQLQQAVYAPHVAAGTALIESRFPGLWAPLAAQLERVRAAKTTGDVVAIATDIAKLLQSPPQQQPQAPQQQPGSGQSGNTQGNPGDAADEPGQGSSSAQSEAGADQGQPETEDASNGETSSTGGQATQSSSTQGNPGDAAEQPGQGSSSAQSEGPADQGQPETEDASNGETSSTGGQAAQSSSTQGNPGDAAEQPGQGSGSAQSEAPADQGQPETEDASSGETSSTGGQPAQSSSTQGNPGDAADEPGQRSNAMQPVRVPDLVNGNTPGDIVEDLAEALEAMLEQIVANGADGVVGDTMPEDSAAGKRGAPDPGTLLSSGADWRLDDTRPVVVRTKALLQSVLEARTAVKTGRSDSGSRIDGRAVHRLALNDARVFRTRREGSAVNTGIVIAVDMSGSMRDNRTDRPAMQAAWAASSALYGLPGVQLGAFTFPGFEPLVPIGGAPNRWRAAFGRVAGGGTPMAEAVITATAQLCDLRCDRRVLIVLTDGAPDNAVEARAAIDLAEHRDVETYCVAIGTDAGKKLFDRWQRIDTVTDLPSKLVALLKRQVLGVSLGDVA